MVMAIQVIRLLLPIVGGLHRGPPEPTEVKRYDGTNPLSPFPVLFRFPLSTLWDDTSLF